MILESFFTILSLRLGHIVVGTIYFILALCILGINMFNFHGDSQNSVTNPSSLIPIIIIVVFALIMLVVCGLMMKAAYDESRMLGFINMGVIVVLVIFWLTLCCISFGNKENYIRVICNKDRCPESLWTMLLHYRGQWRTVDEPNIGRYLGPKDYDLVYDDVGEELTLGDVYLQTVVAESVLPREADTYYDFGAALIVAPIVFLFFFAFFTYSFLLVWSYAVELKKSV